MIKNAIGYVLCRLGFHDWHADLSSLRSLLHRTTEMFVSRKCSRCGVKEWEATYSFSDQLLRESFSMHKA